MSVRHVSFDVWNTLLRPNADFAVERSKLISMMLGCAFTPEACRKAYTILKDDLDRDIRPSALAHLDRSWQCWIELRLSITRAPAPIEDVLDMQRAVEELFLRMPPTINPGAVALVDEARHRGCTLSIGSNTNFISGRVLTRVIDDLYPDVFEFKVFSDLLGCHKPEPQFYELAFAAAASLWPATQPLAPLEFLHIGDSELCDMVGPIKAGYKGAADKDMTKLLARIKEIM